MQGSHPKYGISVGAKDKGVGSRRLNVVLLYLKIKSVKDKEGCEVMLKSFLHQDHKVPREFLKNKNKKW